MKRDPLKRARTRQERAAELASRYHAYEARKASWAARNPSATPSEYEAAMRRIAREVGV